MHARYYDPNFARFLSVDPVLQLKRTMRSPQLGNRYSYALNNPMVFTHPTGETVYLVTTAVGRSSRTPHGQACGEILALPDNQIIIDGHSDSTGSDAYNERLSERRAGSVADYLIEPRRRKQQGDRLPVRRVRSEVLERHRRFEGWTDHVTLNSAQLTAQTYDDNFQVAADRTYAYRLRTTAAPYQYSNADVATTTVFPAVAPGGSFSADAFASVLSAVNSVRAAVGWPAVTWENILSSKDPLPVPGELIMSTHITSARARMNEALQALGVTVQPYTPGEVKGAPISASHLNDIIGRAY